MGITLDLPELALTRARQAVAAGCDGIIASALEAERLRESLGPEPLIVTPGIRPGGQSRGDDQKRVASPANAFRWGADYIVVGRPIRDAADPRAAASDFQREIAAVLE
jgi:orotidine-5'-phosphate decarboxylase